MAGIILLGIVIAWIRWKKKRIIDKVYDRFFGEMMFDDTYFYAHKIFRPTENIIDVNIGKDGQILPSDKQQTFFIKVEEQYDKIIEKIAPMIENEIKKWQPDFKIHNFKTEFYPTFITIPKNEDKEWELVLDSIHDENHTLFICFKDFEPLEIHIDG